jgi:hypothetical protein
LRTCLVEIAEEPGPVALVTHGGVTVDLLRSLIGDDAVPVELMLHGAPSCAITTLDDLSVVAPTSGCDAPGRRPLQTPREAVIPPEVGGVEVVAARPRCALVISKQDALRREWESGERVYDT